jgi:phosphoribosylanthranilate isomerase
MSIAEVRKLTLHEKLQLMEAIWLDLREHVETSDTPRSHRELLDARRERAATGQAAIHDWEQVKHTIGRP